MIRLFFVVLLTAIISAGCSEDIAEADAKYLEAALEGLKLESSAKDTILFFKRYGHDLQVISNCEIVAVEDEAPCASGYRSTGIIKLPSNDAEHGVGLARIYLRLDSEGVLKDYFHDLYYEKLDNSL